MMLVRTVGVMVVLLRMLMRRIVVMIKVSCVNGNAYYGNTNWIDGLDMTLVEMIMKVFM